MDIAEATAALTRGSADGSEVKRIGAALRARGAAQHVDLPRLLADWAGFVADVNNPSWTVDDYTNDLTGRDLLDTAVALASDELGRRIRSLIAPLDDEFRANTVPDHAARLEHYFRIGTGWWWSRLPIGATW